MTDPTPDSAVRLKEPTRFAGRVSEGGELFIYVSELPLHAQVQFTKPLCQEESSQTQNHELDHHRDGAQHQHP